jgi:hypothetical protein
MCHILQVGKEVILFAMLRSDLPIAKGAALSTNSKTMVGSGRPLGKQFCEVMLDHVIRRDAFLPRPYDHMESMAGAYMMSIVSTISLFKIGPDRCPTPSQASIVVNSKPSLHFLQLYQH